MSISKSLLLVKQSFPNKIIIEEDIEKQPNGNRGIYGLFIKRAEKEECAYIGRSEIVSSRITTHLYRIIDGTHSSVKLNNAFLDPESTIICKFLEPVKYEFDNYAKDAQRLASRECYWIDHYQSMNQCLDQVPEGKRPSEQWWLEESKKKKSAKR